MGRLNLEIEQESENNHFILEIKVLARRENKGMWKGYGIFPVFSLRENTDLVFLLLCYFKLRQYSQFVFRVNQEGSVKTQFCFILVLFVKKIESVFL